MEIKTLLTFSNSSGDEGGGYDVLDNVLEGNVLVDRKLADFVLNVERVDCAAVLELVRLAADQHRH